MLSIIGEKQGELKGKVTSVTMTAGGAMVNVDAQVGPFGTVLYTETFGPAVDLAGEAGPSTAMPVPRPISVECTTTVEA